MTARADTGSRPSSGELEHLVKVAPGVTVIWDPAFPHRCVDFAIDGEGDPERRLAGVDRAPWLRLAALTMFDQQLYLPLSRSLLDAEIAAAQLAAARTLTRTESAREHLVGTALDGARRAATGVETYLERLVADDRLPPPALVGPLGTLAWCYAALSGEVRGFDATLAAVTDVWHRLATIERAAPRNRRVVVPSVALEPSRPGADPIDPRAVPARILRLGPTPDAAEIHVDPVRGTSGDALRVWVDAFSDKCRDEVDVGVRVIDRRSGEIRGYGLLGPCTEAEHRFEAVVPLPRSMSAPDVRVDVFGMATPAPAPAPCSELRRVRRATMFLSSWRAVVADVRLWGAPAAPATRLRTIVDQLAIASSPDGPLWSGGPSRAHLTCLTALGDRTLSKMLRTPSERIRPIPGDVGGGAAEVVAAVSGPGDLLAAEVAAAHARSSRS